MQWGNSGHGIAKPFYGLIDETRIWDRLLNATEIRQEMKSPISTYSNSLIASFSFNEKSQKAIHDINHLTKGNRKTGMVFDGVDDYIDLKQSLNINSKSNFTYALWFYANSFNSEGTFIGSSYGDGENFGITRNGKLRFNLLLKQMLSNQTLLSNAWNFVSVSYEYNKTQPENSKISLYINGELDKSVYVSDLCEYETCEFENWNSSNRWIGWDSGTNSYLNGKIDDLKIYNKTLSAEEIKKVYENTYFKTENLAWASSFDDFSNNKIHDRNDALCFGCNSFNLTLKKLEDGIYTTWFYDELSNKIFSHSFIVNKTNNNPLSMNEIVENIFKEQLGNNITIKHNLKIITKTSENKTISEKFDTYIISQNKRYAIKYSNLNQNISNYDNYGDTFNVFETKDLSGEELKSKLKTFVLDSLK